jgi:hypothetical protein
MHFLLSGMPKSKEEICAAFNTILSFEISLQQMLFLQTIKPDIFWLCIYVLQVPGVELVLWDWQPWCVNK